MIEIKKFEEKNIDKLISWIKSAEELMQFAGPNLKFPLTELQLQESLVNENLLMFSVFTQKKNQLIGHGEIFLKEYSFALGRILIGKTENRGKGYGKIITQKLLDFGFENTDKQKAELNVFDWNISAIKAYEKAGFKVNPNQKLEREVNGKIWTAINMIIDKNEYQKTYS